MELSLMSILENAAEEAKNSGSMIACFISPKIGGRMQSKFRDVPGDAVKPRDMHITLGLVRNFESKRQQSIIKTLLNKFCEGYKPFSCKVQSFGAFDPHESNGGHFVLHAIPEAEEFHRMHSRLIPFMKKFGVDIDNGSHDFSPHITIKYCKEKPELDKDCEYKLIIDKLAFAIGDKRHFFNLG